MPFFSLLSGIEHLLLLAVKSHRGDTELNEFFSEGKKRQGAYKGLKVSLLDIKQ